ncbi:MAG TPA: hypothetical protein VOA88_21050 [Candidatus Dormibacteraeota bacterium]|nr:hypothetical protein [Candidatus Dormibacteraeota bacterium]
MAATLKLEPVPTPAVVSPEDILTPEQLADRWQVKPSWVFEQTRKRAKIRNKGKVPLPCHRLGKKILRFYWPEVCEWLLQNKD